MARTKEFIKKNEARILIYLNTVANHMKYGYKISKKLDIDYTYVMKLLEEMYNKGWVTCHRYNNTTYFDITKVSPLPYAIKRVAKAQLQLRIG